MREDALKRHIEKIGRDYNTILNSKSFQYYLEKRKTYLKTFCSANEKDRIIVDLASGTGNYSGSLVNYKYLVNIDLSFNALKANTVLGEKNSRVNANALKIPLKNNSVDLMLLIGLLHHIPSYLEQSFQEVLRVLKSGGTIFIDEPNGYNPIWSIYMKLCEIDRIGAKPIFPHVLKKLAKRYHLSMEKNWYWGFVPPWVEIKFMIDFFNKIGTFIEKSFLSFLCTRYLLILKK